MAMQPTERQLFLIANSIFPYGYDAIKILALPNGAKYRARFDERFVSDQIKRDFSNLRGQSGHYCFRDYESGKIIPLRRIAVDEISLIGSIYYIGYSVQEVYEFPQEASRLEKQIIDFNVVFRESATLVEDVPGHDLRPLVLMSNTSIKFVDDVETVRDEYDRQIRQWASIVRYLGQYKYFKYIPFLRIVGIRALNTGRFQKLQNDMPLTGNTDYELQVVHVLQSDSAVPHSINESRTDRDPNFINRASYKLRISGEAEVFSFQKSLAIMTGSYDINTYVFRTADVSKSMPAHLTIDYTNRPTTLDNQDTSLHFLLDLIPSTNFPTLKIAGLLIFVLIYFLPNFGPGIFQYTTVNPRILQDMSIVAIALTAFDVIGRLNLYVSKRR